MAKNAYLLNEEDRRWLRQLWERVHNSPLRIQTDPEDEPGAPPANYVVRLDDGIPARSGVTPGTESCRLFKLTESGGDYTLAAVTEPNGDPVMVDVYNIFLVAHPESSTSYARVVREPHEGRWLCDPPFSDALIIPFQVYGTDPIVKGGSGSVKVLTWDGDSLEPTGDPFTVYDICESINYFMTPGQRGEARFNTDSNRWEIIETPALLIATIYLDDYLIKGGTVQGTTIDDDNNPTGPTVLVIDEATRFGPAQQGKRATCGVWDFTASLGVRIAAIFALDESKIIWVKATATWTRVSGMNASYVDGVIALDSIGTELMIEAAPVECQVFLPSDDEHSIHPNVREDDVIACQYDDNGLLYCIDPKVSDLAIDDVVLCNQDPEATLRGGWRKVTGMDGRVVMGVDEVGASDEYYDGDPSTVGATGGNTHHKHADHTTSVSISYTPAGTIGTGNANITASGSGSASLSGGGISGSGTSSVTFSTTGAFGGTFATQSGITNVTLNDHAEHSHSLPIDNLNYQSGGSSGPYDLTAGSTGNVTLTHAGLVNDPGHTHLVNRADVVAAVMAGMFGEVDVSDIASSLNLTGTVTITGLTISASDSGHTHTFTGTPATLTDGETLTHDDKGHINPWKTFYFKERFE